MKLKSHIALLILIYMIVCPGCASISEQLIAKRYAEAVLTKNNELVFRFKINQAMIEAGGAYKVKVSIHHPELASVLGVEEIIYGQDIVYSGEYLEARKKGLEMIHMTPIILKKDIHPFELEQMIKEENAITIEVYNQKGVIGKGYLTNFTTQL